MTKDPTLAGKSDFSPQASPKHEEVGDTQDIFAWPGLARIEIERNTRSRVLSRRGVQASKRKFLGLLDWDRA